MSISTSIIFPQPDDYIQTGDRNEQLKYLRELTFTLQTMYENISYGVNGHIRANYLPNQQNWTPILKGTTTPGTFTYTQQSGIALRQGIFTDVWFDINWSAQAGATGDLYVELPYEAAQVTAKPFVGVVQSSVFAYTGGTGIVINAIRNTYRGEFWNVGSGFTTARQLVVNAGQVIGHIRYIGKQNESR